MKRLSRKVRIARWKCYKRLKPYLTARNLLVLGLVCILGLPYLITRTWGWFHFNADTGVIGDTIGGITGPVSGFLGAALVYLALKEQMKANNIIIKQFELQGKEDRTTKISLFIFDQIKLLRDEIKDFNVSLDNSGSGIAMNGDYKLYGVDAIMFLLGKYPTTHVEKTDENIYYFRSFSIESSLRTIDYLLGLIQTSDINRNDSKYLTRIVWDVYETKFSISMKATEGKRAGKQKVCETCNGAHGIPERIFELYDSINNKMSAAKG